MLLLTICWSAALLPHLQAAPAAPEPRVQTRLERVALFKNGLGYFVRRGELSAAQHAALMGPFAAPVHGTFWVSTPATAGLESLVSRQVRMPGAPLEAANTAELLRANVGKQVVLWTDADGKSAISGAIVSYAPDRLAALQPPRTYQIGAFSDDSGYAPWRYNSYGYNNPSPPVGRGEYVLVSTAAGLVSVNPNSVVRAIFPGGDPSSLSTHFATDTAGTELEVNVRAPKAGDWIEVSYLAKGLTWAPSYQVDISDPKTARLTASAVIVNEAEDMVDAHVDLITGFPNIQFQDVLSPVGRKTDLAGFLGQLANRGIGTVGAAGVMTQAVTSNRANYTGGAPPEYGVPSLGEANEDLFFYPIEHVTLKAGETGYYPLFTISVPYQQIYQWQIPDYVTNDYHYTGWYGSSPRQKDKPEIVWHSLRLTNTGQVPWTTAPAETVKNGQILGQDILSYTPPKGQETLRITQALNVRADQEELETDRELNAVQRYGHSFDRLTLEGTLRVTNYKGTPVTVEVSKMLQGELLSTSPEAKTRAVTTAIGRINPVREVVWEITLAPGQSQEITYTYRVLVIRN